MPAKTDTKKKNAPTQQQSEPSLKWFDEAEALTLPEVPKPAKSLPVEAVDACRKRAQDVLDSMTSKRASQKALGNDEKWLQTVVSKGTLTDRVSAMSLLVADQPLLHLNTLGSIVAMCGKNNRRESGIAIRAVKDVFLYNLLPQRKLKSFTEQPLHVILHKGKTAEEGEKDSILVYWLIEDTIKKRYAEYVQVLEKTLSTDLAYVKKQNLMIVWELLCTCPEQEQQLLAILVNKLGDPDRKVGSKAVYLLAETLKKHPGMKLPVVREIERVLFRPNVSMRSQYFATIFLNQMLFSTGDGELAEHLIKIYLAVFNHHLKATSGKKTNKKEPVSDGAATRLLSALLTGVNRAFPFANPDSTVFAEQAGALFSAVHQSSFNTGIQALLLLYQVMSSQSSSSSRFYRAVYQALLNPLLQHSSKHALFLNLLFKTMKNDTSATRVAAFAKRLLQICMQQTPPFVCSALYLLSEVSKTQGVIAMLVSMGSKSEEEQFQDSDKSGAQKAGANKEDDDEEDDDDDEGDDDNKEAEDDEDDADESKEKKTPGSSRSTAYDATKRDPAFANAQIPLFELTQLAHHYHPSVRLWVSILLKKGYISYGGEPLNDFTNASFLDRFVCRNPAKISDDKQRKSRLQARKRVVGAPASAVLEEDIQGGNDDQSFFYQRYYSEKLLRDGEKPQKVQPEGSLEDQMDAFADELMGAEVDRNDRIARKRAGGGGDDDDSDDFNPDDYDYTEDEEEDGDLPPPKKNNKNKKKNNKRSREDAGEEDEDGEGFGGGDDDDGEPSVFAAAEDFQDLLDGTDEPRDGQAERSRRSFVVNVGKRGRGGRGGGRGRGGGGRGKGGGRGGGGGRGKRGGGGHNAKRRK